MLLLVKIEVDLLEVRLLLSFLELVNFVFIDLDLQRRVPDVLHG